MRYRTKKHGFNSVGDKNMQLCLIQHRHFLGSCRQRLAKEGFEGILKIIDVVLQLLKQRRQVCGFHGCRVVNFCGLCCRDVFCCCRTKVSKNKTKAGIIADYVSGVNRV